jgi:hypothetical protein
MGAFDMVSDSDPRAQAHEEAKLHRNCNRISDFTTKELKEELKNRAVEAESKRKKAKAELKIKKEALKVAKRKRYQKYLELKSEFEKRQK